MFYERKGEMELSYDDNYADQIMQKCKPVYKSSMRLNKHLTATVIPDSFLLCYFALEQVMFSLLSNFSVSILSFSAPELPSRIENSHKCTSEKQTCTFISRAPLFS